MGSTTQVTAPVYRQLRVYAFDPYLATRPETAEINSLTMSVPWESEDRSGRSTLKPGPVGEYLEVIDVDPASECFYAPVNLDDPGLLAQDGLAPSEGNPQFHQQMVYAVVMNTIRSFERALGRRALWAPDWVDKQEQHYGFVPRLRVYPHALRDANAYYSRQKRALLFGYFPASKAIAGIYLPGGLVFTCLSHDIVAHETCHALVDGIHPRFLEPSNPDVLAFHEAFADVVALLQHFSFPEVLRDQVRKTQGDLARQSLLGELAQEFGRAVGRYGALRGALGEENKIAHVWERRPPDPRALETTVECHARGSLLVAAIFDAFVGIYTQRAADLLRIATGGAAARPAGELHPDLVNRLAEEAAKSARHLLTICIRALDYCPPVDITFGDYLRALITADYEAVRDDDRGYRLAIIDAFRRHGIYPRNVRTLSEESLRWEAPAGLSLARQGGNGVLEELGGFVDKCRASRDRLQIYNDARDCAKHLHRWLVEHAGEITPKQEEEMGLDLGRAVQETDLKRGPTGGTFEVHSVRPVMRVGPDGDAKPELVVEITQKRDVEGLATPFRGGCTLLVDAETGAVRYCISKNIRSEGRPGRQRDYQQGWHFRALAAMARERTGRELTEEPFALLPAEPGEEG